MGNGKTEAKGPKRVDLQKYQALADKQTKIATEAIASQASTFTAGIGQSGAFTG